MTVVLAHPEFGDICLGDVVVKTGDDQASPHRILELAQLGDSSTLVFWSIHTEQRLSVDRVTRAEYTLVRIADIIAFYATMLDRIECLPMLRTATISRRISMLRELFAQ